MPGLRLSPTIEYGFNGAMPFQAWICNQQAPARHLDDCFNGAMPFQAWIYGGHSSEQNRQVDASMGPCPFRHGYVRLFGTNQWFYTCFNGAMPFQAWISGACGWMHYHTYLRLQWGHALSGMDTSDDLCGAEDE